MNPIGIISLKKYVSVSPQMVIAFFSAEKMLQNYNKYLTYTNKLLFFCRNAIFLHIRCTTRLFDYAKNDAKVQ